MKVDDGVASPWHLPITEVFAPASAPNVYTLAAGEDTVIIYLRESGAKLDTLQWRLVTDNAALTPTPQVQAQISDNVEEQSLHFFLPYSLRNRPCPC